MNFMFSWQEQYLTRSLRSLVRYCCCHSNIKFISSRQRVISSIYMCTMWLILVHSLWQQTSSNFFFLPTAADCPMTACNRTDFGGEKSYKSLVHSLISPRFLKSQPVPGHSTIGRELDHRLIQSQPATHSGSPRLV